MKNNLAKVIKWLYVLVIIWGIPFTEVNAVSKNSTTDKVEKTVITEETDLQYTYTITPLTEGVCNYFYVRTEDPDPTSFRFVDDDSIYASGSSADSPKPTYITWISKEYQDVNYLNKKTLRVNGGYLFFGRGTDGGKLRLEKKEGKTFADTGKTVTIPQLRSVTDYIIATYTTDSMSFFEKLSAAQRGYSGLCRYSGVSVDAGEYFRDPSTPYDAIITQAYADIINKYQYAAFYFHTSVDKPILLSEAYPFFGTSIGFPSQIATIAKRLEPSCSWRWDDYTHYRIHVTFNGETESFGGVGTGKGRQITEDQILYRYSFDGTNNDAYTKTSWNEMNSMLSDYSAIPVPTVEPNPSELTWEKIKNTIQKGKNYARIIALTNYAPGQDSEDYRRGYTCFYKNEDGSAREFVNKWFDGRYYNYFGFFEKGTSFEDEKASVAGIVLENVNISIPKDGKQYFYYSKELDSVSEYDTATGIWKGLMEYKYDKKSGNWISSIYSNFKYKDENGEFHNIENTKFNDAMILTLDEIKAMNIDRNADVNPTSYYNYDGTVPPGTKVN